MSLITSATVSAHARHNDLYLVSVARAEARDMWWLSSSTNWITTEPGKPLAEIDAVLDQIDGGEWARQEAERAAEQAEQAALRERLLAEPAEPDDQAGDDSDSEDDDAAEADSEDAPVPF